MPQDTSESPAAAPVVVFVVEDEVLIQELLEPALEEAGFTPAQVVTAVSQLLNASAPHA